MKKIYKVNINRHDGAEGKYHYTDHEYIATEDINAYIEVKKAEIEARPFWWMDHDEEGGRPEVTAEELEIKEV